MVPSVHSDTTLSPTPFSPFSSAHSIGSEGGTSDEPADLGQFTTVFRALSDFHNPPWPPILAVTPPGHPRPRTPTSSIAVTASEDESEPVHASTVWTQGPIADYLSSSSNSELDHHRDTLTLSDNDSAASDTEGELDSEKDHLVSDSVDQPSLGYLDDVLGFIAAERARFTAQRDLGVRGSSSQASTSEMPGRHVIEPRRKRRRKRGRHGTSSGAPVSRQELELIDNEGEGDDSSSELEFDILDASTLLSKGKGKSMPATPLRRRRAAPRQLLAAEPSATASPPLDQPKLKLKRSRSTPSLHVTIPTPPDSRVVRLRVLARKLRKLFPEDARRLSSILHDDGPDSDGFIDPRGRPPEPNDPLTHIFVDHSNILIGFINHLKRSPIPTSPTSRRVKTHMSHAALALILERGRPVSRRVLATSSPLYQPMESAEKLGYEVRVYARVPDTGDGADRQRAERESARLPQGRRNGTGAPSSQSQSHRLSGAGATSTESDPGTMAPLSASPPNRPNGHSRSSSATTAQTSSGVLAAAGANGSARMRYREQGVDELLQLKLHQTLASVDVAPAGSTIVLATGDGNVGQFNEEGFLGCVRTALKKGWRVELYAWQVGLSKAWEREFASADAPWGGRFRVIFMDRFGADLLEA